MDVSNYKIRVIRTEAKKHDGIPVAASSQLPIDIEGSLLSISCMSSAAKDALLSRDWFKIFFGGLSIYATVRWDNDHKCSVALTRLAICSFGTLPMYWPLYAPPKSEFAHKFDNRRAEERRPRTLSVNIKDYLLKKDTDFINIDFTGIEKRYSEYRQKEAITSDLRLKDFVKSYSMGNKYTTYTSIPTSFNRFVGTYA